MAKKLNGVSSTLTIIFAIFLIACSDSPDDGVNLQDWSAKKIAITSENDLREFALQVNGGRNFFGQTVILERNIELSDGEWVPIGDLSTNPFRGVFDGGGNVIGGVGQSSIGGFSGLFGHLYDAEVKNLGLVVNMNISEYSNSAIGGLAIVNVGTIRNSYVSGNIKISVNQESFIGGAIVALNSGVIENSYANVAIETSNAIGALAGGNHGVIKNSFALRRNVGDVFFAVGDGSICENSGLKSTEEMRQKNTFVAWDFVNLWGIAPNINDGFPYLQNR